MWWPGCLPQYVGPASQFSHSVTPNSLRPCGLQHARLSYPSPTPGACSNSCPLIESVMPSNRLILRHPLFLLLSIFPSIRVFSNESVLYIRWPKYWSFSFSISPPNEYSGLISFRMDWLDPLAVQGTLKSLLQHHSSKASILRCSALFIVPHSICRMAMTKGILASSPPPRGGSRLLKSSVMRGCCCGFCWALGDSIWSVTVDPAEDASKHPSIGCPHQNTRSSRGQRGQEVLTSLAQQRAPWSRWPDHTKTHGDSPVIFSHSVGEVMTWANIHEALS